MHFICTEEGRTLPLKKGISDPAIIHLRFWLVLLKKIAFASIRKLSSINQKTKKPSIYN